MAHVDGLETLERIREMRRDVPVLVSSGFGDIDIEARFASQNVAGFSPKPYTINQLASKVKEILAPAQSGGRS